MFFILSMSSSILVVVKSALPFFNDLLPKNPTSVDSHAHLMLFQTMVVHNSYLWLQIYLRRFPAMLHMNVDGTMLIKIEKEPKSENS